MKLLHRVRQHSPTTDVLVMTAYESMNDAIGCLRLGSVDYILTPFEMDD